MISSMAWARLVLSPATLHSVSSVALSCQVTCTVAVPAKWSIVLPLHYSHTIATYLHTMQALTVLPVRTSCRRIMALMSDALEMCAHALGTCVPSFTGRTARLFFMLEAYGPQGVVGHVATAELTSAGRRGSEPYDMWQRRTSPHPGGEDRSHRTRGSAGAHLRQETRSGAIGHVAAPEPTSTGRRGLKP
jgi:hypothetical protein